MRTFYIVRGKDNTLVGDPLRRNRYAGQRKKTWDEGKMPKALLDRYEPTTDVFPKNRTILKAIAKGELELVKTVHAEGLGAARAMMDKSSPKPKPSKPKTSKPKTEASSE